MSDAEWTFFEPFVVEKGPTRGRRPRDQGLVLDGVFWIARTGKAWRDLHSHFGEWNSVYRQFLNWTLAGVLDVMLQALNETGEGHDSVGKVHLPADRRTEAALVMPSAAPPTVADFGK